MRCPPWWPPSRESSRWPTSLRSPAAPRSSTISPTATKPRPRGMAPRSFLLVELVYAEAQFGARMNVEFAVYPGEVDFDGLDADEQGGRDVAIGHCWGRELVDPALGGG